ncbi:putative ubiquitin-conjugating enzyme E2 38 isoform X2 [Euphorbia lathyris]|uniref:putative ubiquitin-conjugating enzyme E2 38 isoform X2 n=1 Tax=Euphorbia lathyris TaxID=212925 RepID=UPI003313B15F
MDMPVYMHDTAKQVVPNDEMEVERDSDNSEVMIGHEKIDPCSKGKFKVDYTDACTNHMKACDIGISSSLAGSADSMDHLRDDGDNDDYMNEEYEDDKESIPDNPSPVAAAADNEENSIIHKYKTFKQFDAVEDFCDHHFNRKDFSKEQLPLTWAKRIQEEWKILKTGLPDTIFVRVYETRMELLRAVIIGPAGTPYHDGLFFFDCIFPTTYPDRPPMVYYYSGGLRLNPNLYECGKVCLSLLGTWDGEHAERWIPGISTMLQVLLSIQALILNANPFFNEPGNDTDIIGPARDTVSREYNENAFIMSLKTMIYTLRRPPQYFEDFVVGYFQTRARDILTACKAYESGATVGSVTVTDGVADIDANQMSSSAMLRGTLTDFINFLVLNFKLYGSIDCEEFKTDKIGLLWENYQ